MITAQVKEVEKITAQLKNVQGGSGGGYVAQDEAPENTKLLWIDTDDNSAEKISAEDIAFLDGETYQEKYDKGEFTGKDGYTPVRGEDYWTESDKEQIISEVKAAFDSEVWAFTLSDGSIVEKEVALL